VDCTPVYLQTHRQELSCHREKVPRVVIHSGGLYTCVPTDTQTRAQLSQRKGAARCNPLGWIVHSCTYRHTDKSSAVTEKRCFTLALFIEHTAPSPPSQRRSSESTTQPIETLHWMCQTLDMYMLK